MTKIQFQTAHALAWAHSHQWAAALLPELERNDDGTPVLAADEIRQAAAEALWAATNGDIDAIREASRASSPDWSGVDAPRLWVPEDVHPNKPAWGEPGDVWHITGSGRTLWVIEPAGDVYIHIRRPEMVDEVLAANRLGDRWRTLDVGGAYGSRHLAALQMCVKALGGDITQAKLEERAAAFDAQERNELAHAALDAIEAFARRLPYEGQPGFDMARFTACDAATNAVSSAVWPAN